MKTTSFRLEQKPAGDESGGLLSFDQNVVAIRETFSRPLADYRDRVDAALARSENSDRG